MDAQHPPPDMLPALRLWTRGLGAAQHSLLALLGLPLHLLEPIHCLVKVEHCRAGRRERQMVTGLLGTPRAPPPGLSFPICLCWQSSGPGTPRSPWRRPGGAPGVTCSQAGGEAPGLTEVGPVRDDEPLLPVLQACGHGTRSATGPPLGTWGHPPASPRVAVSSRALSWRLPKPTFQGQGPLAPFVPVLSLGPEAEAPLPPGHLRAVCCPPASRQPPGAHLPACLASGLGHCLPASCP